MNKRILKGIALAQFIRKVRGSSYEDDEGVAFLTSLKELKIYEKMKKIEWSNQENDVPIPVKKNQKSNLPKEQKEDAKFFKSHTLNLEESDYWSFNYFNGYILRKTILSQSKCDKCSDALVTRNANSQNSAHTLIKMREFKPGALIRPSCKAISIFNICEQNFQNYRDKWNLRKDYAPKLTKHIIANVNEHIKDVPQCHLKIIVYRWVRARIHKASKFDTEKYSKSNKQNSGHSSKTAARKEIVK